MTYGEFEYGVAKRKLTTLADNLEYRYPNAAGSLLEGLEEALTMHKLNIPGLLRHSL